MGNTKSKYTTCTEAARNGDLESLKLLRARKPPAPWNNETSTQAARNCDFDMLQWMQSQNPPCPWDENVCGWAAFLGRLDILQWLRSQNPPCPWSEKTCMDAAWGGHIHVLQWLRTQDPPCRWDASATEKAALMNRGAIFLWLRQNGCPFDAAATFEMAATRNNYSVLKFLRAQDPPCPWPETMKFLLNAISDQFRIWCVFNMCPLDLQCEPICKLVYRLGTAYPGLLDFLHRERVDVYSRLFLGKRVYVAGGVEVEVEDGAEEGVTQQ